MPSVGPRPQVVLPTSSLPVTKDSKALVGFGNGFSSDSMFGGDVFSATSALPKHDSSVPTFSASGLPASSAIVPVSTATQSSAKPDPLDLLQSSFMRQSTGDQLQQNQSQFKPKQQVPSQSTSSVSFSSVEVGNSSSNQSQLPWPKMTPAGIQKYTKVFVEVDSDRDGKITGEQARNLFLSWRLPRGRDFSPLSFNFVFCAAILPYLLPNLFSEASLQFFLFLLSFVFNFSCGQGKIALSVAVEPITRNRELNDVFGRREGNG